MNTNLIIPGRPFSGLIIVLVTAFLTGFVPELKGQDYTWTGADGASWNVSTNWNPERTAPGPNDRLLFNSGGTITINDVQGQSMLGFRVTNNTSLTLNSGSAVTLTINDRSASITELVIESGSSLTLGPNVRMRLWSQGAAADISGTLVISGGTSYSSNRPNVSTRVWGTVINQGAVNGGRDFLFFEAGSEYRHAVNGNPLPEAAWDPESLCNITGVTSTSLEVKSLGQRFGNFTWNCQNQSVNNETQNWLYNITGTFSIVNTGSGALTQGNMTVGNFVQTGGTFRFSFDDEGAWDDQTLTVNGSFSKSDGTFILSNENYTGTLLVAGNFSHTGGSITETSSGRGRVVFNGESVQLYTGGGTTSGTIDYVVDNGATLQMGTGESPSYITGQDASFTLSAGGTLVVTSQNGIASSAGSGNIRTGTRTFSSGGNYIYSRINSEAVTQVTGNGLPVSLTGNLTVSGGSVLTPSAALTVGGNITIDDGATFTPTGSATVTANGTLAVNGMLQPEPASVVSGTGTLTGTGTVRVTRTTSGSAGFTNQYTISNRTLAGLTVEYYNSSGGQSITALQYGNLALSNTTGTNTAAGDITVTGTLTNSAGTFDIGTNSLQAGAVVNAGQILVNSTSLTVNGSLIADSYSGDGTVTYVRQLRTKSNSGDFHFVGSPLSGNTAANGSIVDRVAYFDEPTNTWQTTSMTSLESGRGYSIRQTTGGNGRITFTGVPATGTVTFTATSPYATGFDGIDYSGRSFASGRDNGTNYGAGGWNLMANPYPSALNAVTFVTENTGYFDPNYQAVYIYDGADGERGTYKYIAPSAPGQTFGGSFGSSYIQAGQGFFVLAMYNNAQFSFTPAMRGVSQGTAMAKSGGEPWPGIGLKVKYGVHESRTVVLFNDNMKPGLDPGYDIGLLSTYPAVEVYTRLAGPDNGVNFARQALPLIYGNDNIIPVGLTAMQGAVVTFSADVLTVPGYNYYLEDRLTGTFTDLAGGSYTVTLPPQTNGTGRFYLWATDRMFTGVETPATGDPDIRVWISNGMLVIDGMVSDRAVVSVYDLTGRKLTERRLTGGEHNTLALPQSAAGILMVRVSDGMKVFTGKIIR